MMAERLEPAETAFKVKGSIGLGFGGDHPDNLACEHHLRVLIKDCVESRNISASGYARWLLVANFDLGMQSVAWTHRPRQLDSHSNPQETRLTRGSECRTDTTESPYTRHWR